MLGIYHSGRVNAVVLISICFHFVPYRVPNIKFNVAKVLESIFPIVDQSVSIILVFSILCSSLFVLDSYCEHHFHSGGGEDYPSMPG